MSTHLTAPPGARPAEGDFAAQRLAPTAAPPQPRQFGRWFVRVVVAALLLVGLAAGAMSGFRALVGGVAENRVLLHRVVRSDLRVTVTEDGNVESARNVEIRCQVAGGSTILSIIPDGSLVKQGDELVRLDSSAIEEQISQQEIVYEKAQAARIEAEKNYSAARVAVQEYLEGTFPMELQTVEGLITVAMENLRSAENILQHTEQMARKGYVTMLQRDAQAFAVEKARIDLEAAQTQKMVLEKFTRAKTLEALESARDTAEAKMRSERTAFELESARLERLKAQLSNSVIIAPTDGMVVYANERSSRSSESRVTIEEGASVRDRQTIIRLPDLSEMQVRVTVHESKVDTLKPGMPAEIRIQGRRMWGSVISIANQPEPGSWFSSNVKEYATIVRIDGTNEQLRPGMTAEVVILVDHVKDVLTVPVQAVVDLGGKHYVWVKQGTELERRPVVLGLTNHTVIEIKDGVAEGEWVVLNPRAATPEAREERQTLVDRWSGDGAPQTAGPARAGATTDDTAANRNGAASAETAPAPGTPPAEADARQRPRGRPEQRAGGTEAGGN